jgi:mannose-6-phosphate isomerase-like protein (cupin superfamily)
MPESVDRSTAEHYVWGGMSDGWRLLDRDDLSVIEERVPPGGAEESHVHAVARQFFVLLEGSAVMQTATGNVTLRTGQGVEIPPGLAHRFTNPGDVDVRFLVISSPTTRGDREPRSVS